MKSQENQHFISTTGERGKQVLSVVDAFSPDDARVYATKLFHMKVKGWGDEARALEDCAFASRMTPLGFKRLMNGKTKDPTLGVFGRVRKAYLDYCARKAAELLAIVEEEKARNGNVHIGDLDQQVSYLVARIEAARSIEIKATKGR
jgi:hypothetical protein